MRKQSPPPEAPKGFNLKVTYRDEITGAVTHTDPYTLRVVGETGSSEKARYFERPKGSGNLWDSKGEACGRWVYDEKIEKGRKVKVGRYDAEAPHIAWVPPLTEDQKIAQENAALKAELAAMKAEKEKSSEVKAKK